MLPVIEKRRLDVCDLEPMQHPEPDLVAILGREAGIVAADGLEHPFADQGARAVRGEIGEVRLAR